MCEQSLNKVILYFHILSAYFFFKYVTFSKFFQEYNIRESNSSSPDQAWQNTQPELDPNCLPRLAVDNKSKELKIQVIIWAYAKIYIPLVDSDLVFRLFSTSPPEKQ